MKKIKIKGKNYNIKYTIRALFIFEAITGKPFSVDTLLDHYIFFYSMILANNQDKAEILSWDDFIEALDADPNLFGKINEAVEQQQKKDELFNKEEEDPNDPEKKN